jgi:hypothetical protein
LFLEISVESAGSFAHAKNASGKDPWGGFRRGYETTSTIRRGDYRMEFMMGGVDDDILIA